MWSIIPTTAFALMNQFFLSWGVMAARFYNNKPLEADFSLVVEEANTFYLHNLCKPLHTIKS